jgi:hypothetical protein
MHWKETPRDCPFKGPTIDAMGKARLREEDALNKWLHHTHPSDR